MGNRTWAAATRETSIRVFGVKEVCCERKEGRIVKNRFLDNQRKKRKKIKSFRPITFETLHVGGRVRPGDSGGDGRVWG